MQIATNISDPGYRCIELRIELSVNLVECGELIELIELMEVLQTIQFFVDGIERVNFIIAGARSETVQNRQRNRKPHTDNRCEKSYFHPIE